MPIMPPLIINMTKPNASTAESAAEQPSEMIRVTSSVKACVIGTYVGSVDCAIFQSHRLWVNVFTSNTNRKVNRPTPIGMGSLSVRTHMDSPGQMRNGQKRRQQLFANYSRQQ